MESEQQLFSHAAAALDYGPHECLMRIIERSQKRNPTQWPDPTINEQSRS